MSNMVTNNTSTIPPQSTVAPAKTVNTDPVNKGGNQPISPEPQRQEPAAEDVRQNMEKCLDEVVEQLNDYVQQIQRDLSFSVDEASGKTVVTVLDSGTKEVIRQIPSEEVLNRLRNMGNLQGLLFKDQA